MWHADAADIGSEQFNEEDRRYSGSRFRDVVDALFANPYQAVWGRAGEPPLPVQDVTIRSVFGGLLAHARPNRFERASARTLDSGADLRWGPDRKGFARLLHPNGVCLVGRWQITEDTPYSGYFARGRTALVVARYSSGAGGPLRGRVRSLALVGKLFPTTDPDHPTPLRTANFITQEDIGGARSDSINAAELRNAPDVTVFRRGPAGTILIKIATVFRHVDKQPTIRQLYPIAELGKAGGRSDASAGIHAAARRARATRDPRRGSRRPRRGHGPHLRQGRSGAEADADVHHRGHRRREDDGHRRSACAARSGTGGRLASLVFDNAVVSYNGDAVIHFTHPTWRQDRNDPGDRHANRRREGQVTARGFPSAVQPGAPGSPGCPFRRSAAG